MYVCVRCACKNIKRVFSKRNYSIDVVRGPMSSKTSRLNPILKIDLGRVSCTKISDLRVCRVILILIFATGNGVFSFNTGKNKYIS